MVTVAAEEKFGLAKTKTLIAKYADIVENLPIIFVLYIIIYAMVLDECVNCLVYGAL